jgi:hypothetical protein
LAVGEAFPTGPAFLLVKSFFPPLKTPTVLSQQERANPVGKAFANSTATAVGEGFNSDTVLFATNYTSGLVGEAPVSYCACPQKLLPK